MFGRPTPLRSVVRARRAGRRPASAALVASILLGGVSIAGGASADPGPATATTPATEQVLLPAPDTTGPTARGTFVADPQGQIEQLAAGGHLVAWSVRTPADRPHGYKPVTTLPTESHVVIVDERGGTALTIPVGARWVSGLRMLRGAGGPAQPQLAITSCSTADRKHCATDLYTLTPDAPVTITAHETGALADAAGAGQLDSGRVIRVAKLRKPARGKPKACLPALSLRTLATGETRALPALPRNDSVWYRCRGLQSELLDDRSAFATVRRDDPDDSMSADLVYGLDTAAAHPTWVFLDTADRVDGEDAADGFGPGVTDGAITWEVFSEGDDDSQYDLVRHLLPGSLAKHPTGAAVQTDADPISATPQNVCAMATTDDAFYELSNVRCAADTSTGAAGPDSGINRLVNPSFTEPKR